MSIQGEARLSDLLDDADGEMSSLAMLNRTVWDRRSEFLTSRQIRIKIGTWNVAAIAGTEKDVAGWFVHGKGVMKELSGLRVASESRKSGETTESIEDQESRSTPSRSTLPLNDPRYVPGDDDIGLYVLGLQELVDVSSPTEALRPYHDKAPGEKWKSSLLAALPKGYTLVAEQQLVGMYILIYASSSLNPSITNVSCKFVGTGLMGYMGNKGAVVVRLLLGDTTKIVFVNSHLAAGAQPQSVDRRNWDAEQIVSRTRFAPIDRGHGVLDEVGDVIGEEDFAFWFGDLNYRLADLPGDDIRRLLFRHSKEQYEKDAVEHSKDSPESYSPRENGEGNSENGSQSTNSPEIEEGELDPDQDPASLETTLASLLPHDELGSQMSKKKAFHQGWREGRIRFMPTYKYDVGSVGMFDSSEKKRAPSWCDRILFRTKGDYIAHQKKENATPEVKDENRPNVSESSQSSFDYDPETDAYDPAQDTSPNLETEHQDQGDESSGGSDSNDSIKLEYYTSHQRVLSSDHKPLDAVFTISYKAIDPDRRAVVYQQVARDLDRKENESRPTLSVAVDTPEGKSSQELIDFGEVHFNQRVSKVVTLANTGRVNAIFGFVIHDQGGSDRRWLEIDCDHDQSKEQGIPDVIKSYCIAPGETWTANVTFQVKDALVARHMTPFLEDVLILRVAGGRDHFLTLKARWLRSTLGLSVDELIRLPEAGIRAQSLDEEVKCSAPRELFKLTEALENNLERLIAEWGMKGDADGSPPWQNNGWPFTNTVWLSKNVRNSRLVDQVQELLDTNQSLNMIELTTLQKSEVYAAALVRFLDSLHDGIVNERLWLKLREEMIVYEKVKKPTEKETSEECIKIAEILSLSTPHNVSFQLIITMLRRIIAEVAMSQSVAHSPSTQSFKVDEDQQAETRARLRSQYAAVFQELLFRPRPGEDGNATGKEASRNANRRSTILDLCIQDSAGSI